MSDPAESVQIVRIGDVTMTAAQDQIAAALAGAHGEIRDARRNNTNPHLRNKFADLSSVLAAVRGPLARHGLAVTMHAQSTPTHAGVVYVLTHSSGQWQAGALMHERGRNKGLSGPQADGVCLSYARRYALMGLAACAAGDDVDGAGLPAEPNRAHLESARDRLEYTCKAAHVTLAEVDAWGQAHGRPAPRDMDAGTLEKLTTWLSTDKGRIAVAEHAGRALDSALSEE